MDFSVGFGRGTPLDEIAALARTADQCGFKQMTLCDQENVSRDVYVMMSVAAINTQRILIGQGVTVPFIRHPAVTANATWSVNELSGGRVFLGIGAGGNAVRSMGIKARPLKEFRATVEFIKSYMRGEEVEWQGLNMASEWIKQPLPIYMGASGPLSCKLAGELADGVVFGTGSHPEIVKWRLELIQQGAERAGRDFSKIDLWLRTCTYVGESREAALREVAAYSTRGVWASLGLNAHRPEIQDLHRRLRHAMPDFDDLMAEGKRAFDGFDETYHEVTDAPHGRLVTQRMSDFLHLTGTPDDIGERIERLGELGVKNISSTLYTIVDKHGMMREISSKLMPRFQPAAVPA